MTDTDPFHAEVLAELADLARAEQRGEVELAPLRVGPFTAFTMIGALQLAWRHPDMSATQKKIIERTARQLQPLFSGVLATALERGWDTGYDVEAG